MTALLCVALHLTGLAVVGWVGSGYVGHSPLALGMTALIGAVYLVGGVELLRFHRHTAELVRALESLKETPARLEDWLARVPGALRNSLRLRIEGERGGLPGPAVTPYLVGLLVLLGMLGTFLGMVMTLNGAVLALESTTDLQTIRSALAAPVKGLGVAFGTSIAGVAASAMLGLVSALCRRARLQAVQVLDGHLASTLRSFSLAQQRQETLLALQAQSQALPSVVDKLEALLVNMEQHQQQLSARLVAGQDAFHDRTRERFTGLADSVAQSLQASLTDAARIAGETIAPAVDHAMAGIADRTTALHVQVSESVQRQLDGLANRFNDSVTEVSAGWQTALATQVRTSDALAEQLRTLLQEHAAMFAQGSEKLLDRIGEHAATLYTQLAANDRARLDEQRSALEAMSDAVRAHWHELGQREAARQAQLCRALEDTAVAIADQGEARARATSEEIARLLEAAAEAPRAAAEVVSALRGEVSAGIARETAMLQEREALFARLASLLATLDRGADAQREAVDALLGAATTTLEGVSAQFAARIDDRSAQMDEIAGELGASAAEVASLGEAFGAAVRHFAASSEAVLAGLARVESALDRAQQRSDEQLAYYVAQARELIDLTLMSQKQIIDGLQQQGGRRAVAGEEA